MAEHGIKCILQKHKGKNANDLNRTPSLYRGKTNKCHFLYGQHVYVVKDKTDKKPGQEAQTWYGRE